MLERRLDRGARDAETAGEGVEIHPLAGGEAARRDVLHHAFGDPGLQLGPQHGAIPDLGCGMETAAPAALPHWPRC